MDFRPRAPHPSREKSSQVSCRWFGGNLRPWFLSSSGRRLARRSAQRHARLPERTRALAEVAFRAGRDGHFSQLVTPPRARGTTWSKVRSPFAPQYWQQNSSRRKRLNRVKGDPLLRLDVVLQDHHRRDADFRGGRADHLVVFRHDVDPVEPCRLDRFLPGPERERVVGKRSVIGIEHQRGMVAQRIRLAYETRPEIAVHDSCLPLPRFPVRGGVRPGCVRLYLAAAA